MNDEKNKKENIVSDNYPNRVISPERLDEYVRTASPKSWLILVALFIVLIAFIIWGIVGTIPINYSTKGVGMSISYNVGEKKSPDELTLEDYEVNGVLCFIDANDLSSREINEKPATVKFRDGTTVCGTALLLQTNPDTDDEIKKDVTIHVDYYVSAQLEEGLITEDVMNEIMKHYELDMEWIFSQLGESESKYRYPVYVQFDETLDYLFWGEVADVNIEIKQEKPIRFLFAR